jgi:acyl transferase domain-containing protein
VPLPSYPWQRKRYWVDEVAVAEPAAPAAPAEPAAPVVVPSAADLTKHLVLRAAEVLAAAPESVDPAMPLTVSGMDSLLAAKLRMRLKQDLDLHVPVGELLGGRSLKEVASRLANRQREFAG